ncbi:MAG: ubiquitin-like domain-containing protein [Acutalibacteraceae bacterium]|nr:ubiquitin-like domain-containing protein [Acutalibacteraceae bacterium]
MNTIKSFGKAMLKSKAKLIMLVVIAILCSATIYAAAANSDTVTLEIDGETTRVITMRDTAEEILAQVGIEVSENDVLDLADFDKKSIIRLHKSHSFTVADNGADAVSYEGKGTVAEALEQNGIAIKDGDILNCSVEDRIADTPEVIITRAFEVKIVADGETKAINIAGGTVSDALDKAVITIDDNDEISKPLDTELEADLLIKITRVDYKTKTETVEMNYKTVTKKSATMYTDQAKIETKGVKGVQTITYQEKYVDGVLTESVATSSVVEKAPVDEVKTVGTKKLVGAIPGSGYVLPNGKKTISTLTPPSSLQLDGNVPVSYKKKIVGTASAYNCGTHTATGKRVRPGYIAVNPKQIPYGTKMWIVSNDGKYVYGYASAEDTGGFTKWTGSRATLCDLYFPNQSSMYAFGRRTVTIYIL